jgi:prepilin-type N-terminal cleavage/methylation domain-containing protein
MRKRQGFTLVELMVVMAIVLIIMVILSRAFGDSLATLRKAKAIGDLQEKLRAATMILRRDLSADHFDGRRRVSDWSYDWNSVPVGSNWPQAPRRVPQNATPIRQGCFHVWPPAAPTPPTLPTYTDGGTVFEGTDDNNFPSYRVTNRSLHFTVKLRGNDPQKMFSARVPAGSPLNNPNALTTFFKLPTDARFQDPTTTDTFNSQWAEVYYHLQPNGGMAGNTTLYGLYRGQYLLVANNSVVNGQVQSSATHDYAEISCKPDPKKPSAFYFNTPEDLANGGQSNLADPEKLGTLLLSDVVSFEISLWNREMWYYLGSKSYDSANPGLTSFMSSQTSNPFQPAAYFSPDPSQPTATWKGRVPADAIRIVLRVWDIKSQQTRQITVWQDI